MRPMVGNRSVLALLSAMTVLVGVAIAATPVGAHTCGGGVGTTIRLSGFPPLMNSNQPYFYYAPENVANTNVQVTAFIGCAGGGSAVYSADLDTPPGSPNPADSNDYQSVHTRPSFSAPEDHRVVTKTVQVPLDDDTAVEPLAETVSVQLSAFSNGAGPGTPSQAPLYLVDNEGVERTRFVTTSMSVDEGVGAVRIPVLRAGALDGGVNFSVTPATADISPATGAVQFAPDGRFGVVNLSVVNDTQPENAETFSISLSGASIEGGPFSLTIGGNDGGSGTDTIAPQAWFHHPKHRVRYERSNPLLDSIHLFVTDNSGRSAIENAQGALRKKLNGGDCKWWRAGGWQTASCTAPQWFTFNTHYADGARELYIYTAHPPLAPSVGTAIRNYRVYGQATDASGNTSPLRPDENKNTFEVIRG